MNNVLDYLKRDAERHPDKKAVGFREEGLTFGELYAAAETIGNELIRRGIGGSEEKRDQAVAVLAGQHVFTPAAFFGVLWTGCFYVPVDPEMPREKQRSMIEDCGTAILLGVSENKDLAAELGFGDRFLAADELLASAKAARAAAPIWQDDRDWADEPLYMVYTSGSTGKPKGVLKTHGAEIDYIETYVDHFGFTENEVIGNQTPFFFDASGKDLYLMLKTGSTLEILASQLFMMPTQLIEYMNERKVTFASWVPSAISVVAQLNPFGYVKPEYLKKVFFVGEVMPMKHLNKWIEFLPDIDYVNLYGASELAGICCYFRVSRHFENEESLPIGEALPNCRIYLIDEKTADSSETAITPIKECGHKGEIFIVSKALAREYYHDPEKTSRSFLIRDFGDGSGPVRCFRTGDIAQYNERDELVFASRSDFQIKHMGHRIELGEIETIAGSLEGIRKCCCLYDADKKKILLFTEPEEGADLDAKKIRTILKDKLSSYMLPGKIHVLEKLPLNANGKIDRPAIKSLYLKG